MPVILYYFPSCGPCRAVQMTAAHLGIQLVKKKIDVIHQEQMKPEFLEINPQHCVPTIDDDGFYLWESNAILTYLVNKYAPGSPLYPRDPKERATVEKMLHFDVGILKNAITEYAIPLLFEGRSGGPEKEDNLKKALTIFENILLKTSYAAGNHLTLADYSILSNIVFTEEVTEFNFDEYPKISAWLARMKKETPNYAEINEIPIREFKNFVESTK